MSVNLPFAIAGLILFAAGLYGLFVRPTLLRKVIAVNVTGSGVFLVIIATNAGSESTGSSPDPVPQAMVLTGIVIAVAVTAYALSLIRRISDETDQVSLSEDSGYGPAEEVSDSKDGRPEGR